MGGVARRPGSRFPCRLTSRSFRAMRRAIAHRRVHSGVALSAQRNDGHGGAYAWTSTGAPTLTVLTTPLTWTTSCAALNAAPHAARWERRPPRGPRTPSPARAVLSTAQIFLQEAVQDLREAPCPEAVRLQAHTGAPGRDGGVARGSSAGRAALRRKAAGALSPPKRVARAPANALLDPEDLTGCSVACTIAGHPQGIHSTTARAGTSTPARVGSGCAGRSWPPELVIQLCRRARIPAFSASPLCERGGRLARLH